ncbi:hypothetical protein L3Q67_25780 [Saccharothrix sp. AJ9571]|nr:hypothetical protein L3Q67_25780 [Saccharothrix sp. AJ9571]
MPGELPTGAALVMLYETSKPVAWLVSGIRRGEDVGPRIEMLAVRVRDRFTSSNNG